MEAVSATNSNVTNDWTIFALTAVAYRNDSVASVVFAISSLCPLVVVICVATLIVSRRDLHTVCERGGFFYCLLHLGFCWVGKMTYFVGQLLNEVANQLLKRWVKQPRPQLLDVPPIHYGKYGWPSNHAQFITFFAVYFALFTIIRLRVCTTGSSSANLNDRNNGRDWCAVYKPMLLILLLAIATVVCVGRVHLGQHSTDQVVWGCVIGAVTGVLWFCVVHLLLTPHFPTISQWPVCEWLLIRDCTSIPNVLWFEYSITRSEARSRHRKNHRSFKHE